MKNSNEWLDDIERKLNERYDRRNKMRKKAVHCIGGLASCSLILLAVLALPKNIMPTPNGNMTIDNTASTTVPKTESPTSTHNTGHKDNSSEIDITTEHTDIIIDDTTEQTTISNEESTISKSDSTDNISTTVPDDIPIDSPTIPSDIIQEITQPLENQEQPTQTTIIEPTTPIEPDYYINNIIGTAPIPSIAGMPAEEQIWSYEQMVNYYEIDFAFLTNNVLFESDYAVDVHDEYLVSVYNDGRLATDLFEILYYDSYGKNVKISASKVSYPYEFIYQLESKFESDINGYPIVIGGMSLSNTNEDDFFCADFQKNGVKYRLTGENMSDSEFFEIVKNFLSL